MDPLRALLPAFQQPLDRKLGCGILQLHLEQVLTHTCQLQEVLVAPDDLAGVRTEHHDRQR